jgi:multidrug efflux pump subunit AcrA (membrane-fusion protein)
MQHDDEQTDADTRSAAEPTNKRSRAKGWILAGIVIATAAIGWAAYTRVETDAVAKTGPAALPPVPQVIVSKPLVRELDSRLGFLGQFSAVEQVELRAQVGGTLTGIHFQDGDIVHKGDLLFTIDARPYEIKLAQANAQLETASARLALANRELHRAQELAAKAFGTEQTVDQRTADRQTAQAAVDDAKAQIRDAEFDLSTAASWPPSSGA